MLKKKLKSPHKIWLYMLSCFLAIPCTIAHADMRTCKLSPTRIIMEGRTRSATIMLINTDDVVNTYKVNLTLMKMDDQGELLEIKNPDAQQQELLKMFRFSPRRARVEPRKYQNIRIMVRKPADLPAGEYRVHLRATPLSPPPAPSQKSKQEAKISIQLDVVMATSIPIIVRHGEGSVTLKPASCILGKDGKSLSVQVNRTGEYSAYFGIVAYRMGASGAKEKIAEKLGLGFYPPLTQRILKLPLENPELFHSLAGQQIFLEILNYENLGEPAKGPWEFTL